MNKIIVNLTHSFHFEDLTQIEELMKRDGYTNVSMESTPEVYQEYAEELAIKSLLDFNKEDLYNYHIRLTTEII
jgi:hypothetical protein